MIDLNPSYLAVVERILAEHVPECEVRAFGSRASWTAKDYSDLDLAIVGDGPLDWRTLALLKEAFEQSNLPMRVDVLDWHNIAESFQHVIERNYVVLQVVDNTIEKLSNGWPVATLGECATINDATYALHENWPFINYLDTGSITDNRISEIQCLVAGEDTIPSRARRKVRHGDIVYSTVRPNQRHFGLIQNVPENFLASTGFAVIRGKPDVAHTDFLYWFLAQNEIVEYLHAIAEHSTSAYPSIRPSDLATLTVPLPPLPEQRAIAHILGTLDDKIELNRRMNETLEEMARALFRSWLVDFEPVRAKMEGHWRSGEPLPGLPADLYDLFPDRLVPSELGNIPEGWQVKTLGDITHKPQYGYTETAKDDPVGPKFLRITDINKKAWVEWESVPYCEISEEDFDKYRLHKGDILIARIADPGHGCMIEENLEAVFASYLIRFRPTHERYARLLQYWLRSDVYWNLVRGRGTGTTRIGLNAKVLGGFPILVPSNGLAEAFSKEVDSLRARVVANMKESHILAAQRDALLPRLVSGEVEVV